MNDITIAIKIFDFKFEHDYISNLFGLSPKIFHRKGDSYEMGSVIKVHDSNYWDYRIHIKKNNIWIKEIIDRFVQENMLDKENVFENLKGRCTMELYISVWFYDNPDNFHFDSKLLSFFSKYEIDIDIDQYLHSR